MLALMLFFKNKEPSVSSMSSVEPAQPQSPIDPKQLPPTPIPESDPPPYPLPSTSRPARVNFLHIGQVNRAIDDSWTVDPLLRIPPALMPSKSTEDKSELPNLYLKNTHYPIVARLYLVSERPCRSRIVIHARHKDATVTIVERQSQSFYLNVKSSHATVKVAIPRDFNGPITLTNASGKIELSEGIKTAMTPFSPPPSAVKMFIGSWDLYGGNDGSEEWMGDEVVLECAHKPIKLFFTDEIKL
ncbi:hypothetical protein FRB90_006387 [Tulasnella sp. 427]|nr:hypothetical protein FRB90_006387 [Tulasnella sp. 427]